MRKVLSKLLACMFLIAACAGAAACNESGNGAAGIVFGEKEEFASLSGGYLAVSSAGIPELSEGMKTPEFSFESGYRYRVERTSKKLTVFRREYASYGDAGFKQIYASTVPRGGNALGIFTRSEGSFSASALIDDFSVFGKDGLMLTEDFDRGTGGVQTVLSNPSCYAQQSMGTRYEVVFVDLDGNVLKVTQLCEYDYAACEAPAVEGKHFVRWSEPLSSVVSDLIVYPVYEDGTVEKNDGGGGAEVRLRVLPFSPHCLRF